MCVGNKWVKILTFLASSSLFNHTATFRRESDYPLSTQWMKMPENMFSEEFFVSTKEKNR